MSSPDLTVSNHLRRDGTFGVPAALPKVKKPKKVLAPVPDAWAENDPNTVGPSPSPGLGAVAVAGAREGGVITGSIISKAGSEGGSGGSNHHHSLGIADLPPPVTNHKAAAIAATLSPSGGYVHWHTPSHTPFHTAAHASSNTPYNTPSNTLPAPYILMLYTYLTFTNLPLL